MSVIRKIHPKSIYDGNYECRIEEYDSVNELVRDLMRRPITNDRFNNMKDKNHSYDWDGVESYGEALSLLHSGYQPTVDELKAKLRSNKVGAESRVSFTNNVVGYAPVVPLVLKGLPNNMIDMTQKSIKCKVVDIYYNISVLCSISSKQILRAGSQLLGAIINLEQSGYRFNLYTIQDYSDGDSSDAVAVKIKSSTQPLDLKRMSFMLTHTASFRVIGFDWYSKFPEGEYRYGYGHNINDECRNMQEWVKEVFGSNSVYIGADEIIQNNYSDEYIKQILTSDK